MGSGRAAEGSRAPPAASDAVPYRLQCRFAARSREPSAAPTRTPARVHGCRVQGLLVDARIALHQPTHPLGSHPLACAWLCPHSPPAHPRPLSFSHADARRLGRHCTARACRRLAPDRAPRRNAGEALLRPHSMAPSPAVGHKHMKTRGFLVAPKHKQQKSLLVAVRVRPLVGNEVGRCLNLLKVRARSRLHRDAGVAIRRAPSRTPLSDNRRC